MGRVAHQHGGCGDRDRRVDHRLRVVTVARLSKRIRHKLAPAAPREVLEGGHLSGRLEGVSIHRVVKALDIDASAPTAEPQGADQIGPVGVAKSRCAVVNVGHAAADTVLADHVPEHGRVLAVDVPDAAGIFPKLWQRVDEAHKLMAGLPFQADGRALDRREHRIPGGSSRGYRVIHHSCSYVK